MSLAERSAATGLSRLSFGAKVGIVAGGYVAAFAIASLVLRVYVAATSGPDRQTYGGMFAFGDSLLFLAMLGLAALPATALGLFVLRWRPGFWRVLSGAAQTVASTALVALLLTVAPWRGEARTTLGIMTGLAPLRILAAPLLALVSLLGAAFAPTRSARVGLLGASAIEIVAFVCGVLGWWASRR